MKVKDFVCRNIYMVLTVHPQVYSNGPSIKANEITEKKKETIIIEVKGFLSNFSICILFGLKDTKNANRNCVVLSQHKTTNVHILSIEVILCHP